MKEYRTCEHCGANLDPDEKCDCGMEPFSVSESDTERELSAPADKRPE